MIIFPNWPVENLGQIPSEQKADVGTGIKGNLNTIQVMCRVARQEASNPLINRLAKNIVFHAKIPSHYYREEARAIGEWVQKHVRYVRDPEGVEQLSSPLMLISQMQGKPGYASGDCDDHSLLIATLCLSIGIRPYFRAARFNTTSGNYNHIYVVTYEGDMTDSEKTPVRQELVIDAIVKDRPIGFELKHASHDDYAV